MKYVKVTSPDVNNGVGNRVTLWVSGCNHKCKGCHNEWLQDYTKGKILTEAVIEIYEALEKPYIKGLTISGGDPLYQSDESLDMLYDLILNVRKDFPDKNIWIFSGFTLDEIVNDPTKSKQKQILDNVDYFVDGRFVEELKDAQLPFRGSRNQVIWKRTPNGNFERVDDNFFRN